jgi:hypothetical protein
MAITLAIITLAIIHILIHQDHFLITQLLTTMDTFTRMQDMVTTMSLLHRTPLQMLRILTFLALD